MVIVFIANSPMSRPNRIDIAIVGAGAHALTLVTHLLQKRRTLGDRVLAFDPSGEWMHQWNRQFAALEIPHLRSPAVHHSDPNPYALRRFAQSRPHELFAPYDLPGTQLFRDFCQDVVRRWNLRDRVVSAKVEGIEPLAQRFGLHLDSGEVTIARRVVVATGGGVPNLPDWVQRLDSSYPSDRLCHSTRVDLRPLQLHGERILVVGGGLTAGHLAIGALARQATVGLVLRGKLTEKLFDADPGWLGPKYLKAFAAEPDWQRRWQLVQQARGGGSVTPEVGLQLRRAMRDGNLHLRQGCQIRQATWTGTAWQVRYDTGEIDWCDRLWLATGTRLDVTADPLFRDILATYPNPVVRGLPVLDERLRWNGCPLFVMGGLAALQVGPVARNLSGARMASDRIVPALVKPSLARMMRRSGDTAATFVPPRIPSPRTIASPPSDFARQR
jgi:cation diffusion facilitator CzcD-associated flavoprotein CzcO